MTTSKLKWLAGDVGSEDEEAPLQGEHMQAPKREIEVLEEKVSDIVESKAVRYPNFLAESIHESIRQKYRDIRVDTRYTKAPKSIATHESIHDTRKKQMSKPDQYRYKTLFFPTNIQDSLFPDQYTRLSFSRPILLRYG